MNYCNYEPMEHSFLFFFLSVLLCMYTLGDGGGFSS